MAKKAAEAELKRKMAASVAGTGPTLIPAGIGSPPPPPPEKDKEDPTVYDLVGDEDDRVLLRQLVRSHVELNSKIKFLDKLKESITGRIKTLLGTYGIGRMNCDGASVAYFTTQRTSINRLKLIGAGVPEAIIDRCTDTTESATLKITGPK